MNKVIPEKLGYVQDFARRGLKRLGIDLLGVVPMEPLLANATLGQICRQVKGTFLNGRTESRRRVKKVIIGAMNSTHVMDYFEPGTLVVTPGDREDIILAALSTASLSEKEGRVIAGLVLSGDLFPHQNLLDLIKASHLVAIASPFDSYTVASSIYSMTVKTLPGDDEKIGRIQALIEQHVEVDRLLEKLGAPPEPAA
jgi:BioD-like phosphotransacetylase family protein